jgi:hypothetical protein
LEGKNSQNHGIGKKKTFDIRKKKEDKLGMIFHTHNSSTWEAKRGRLKVGGQPWAT